MVLQTKTQSIKIKLSHKLKYLKNEIQKSNENPVKFEFLWFEIWKIETQDILHIAYSNIKSPDWKKNFIHWRGRHFHVVIGVIFCSKKVWKSVPARESLRIPPKMVCSGNYIDYLLYMHIFVLNKALYPPPSPAAPPWAPLPRTAPPGVAPPTAAPRRAGWAWE